MQNSTIMHLNLFYDQEAQTITEYHFIGGSAKPPSKKTVQSFDRDSFKVVVEEYWKFVGQLIRSGTLNADDSEERRRLLGDLRTWGQRMADIVFPSELQREIWLSAAQSNIVVVDTQLAEVPWEALYCAEAGETGQFLIENCILQRQIYSDEFENDLLSNKGPKNFICVDPELLREEREVRDSKFGQGLVEYKAEYYETRSSIELAEKVRDGCVIHWICEHVSNKGLRLANDTYYTEHDIRTHKFPSGSTLFLFSCNAALDVDGMGSFSSKLASMQGCTVVAPLSVVAAGEAERFVAAIQDIIESNDDLVRLSDIWSRIKGPLGGMSIETQRIAFEDCYLLWFGIYGDCSTFLTTGGENDVQN